MPVDAIGSILGSESNLELQSSTLSQEEFLRLFLTELNFQDPLEPINNREFLAQIAEFAGLEQNRQTTETLKDLVYLNSTSQSVSLLGREVDLFANNAPVSGTVSAIRFLPGGAELTVNLTNGGVLTNVRLSEITRIE